MENITAISPTDDVAVMAHKIYNDFKVGQSCTIKGFVFYPGDYTEETPIPKGLAVKEQLDFLDREENVYVPPNDLRPRRRRVKPPNTIGDFVAQKMFRWEESTRDGVIVYMIWRMQ